MKQRSLRRKVLGISAVTVGLLLVVALGGVIAGIVGGKAVMSESLDAQQQHLIDVRDEVAALPSGVFEGWEETPIPDVMPWDRVQTIGTHNSYAMQPNGLQNAILSLVSPQDVPTLAYSHPPLWQQFDEGVRSIELDLRVHSNGDLRVTHVPLVANGSNAPDFMLALEELSLWSSSHPGHLPITVLIEFKSDYAYLDPSLAPWSAETLQLVDAAIEKNLGSHLVRPDDVSADTWPSVGELRDKVIVIMHPDDTVEQAYASRAQHERTMFIAMSETVKKQQGDLPVFVVHNDPDVAQIAPLIETGAIVRTRADADLLTSVNERERAFESGAQIISTDFPAPNTQESSGYTVAFENGLLTRVDPARQPTAEQLRH